MEARNWLLIASAAERNETSKPSWGESRRSVLKTSAATPAEDAAITKLDFSVAELTGRASGEAGRVVVVTSPCPPLTRVVVVSLFARVVVVSPGNVVDVVVVPQGSVVEEVVVVPHGKVVEDVVVVPHGNVVVVVDVVDPVGGLVVVEDGTVVVVVAVDPGTVTVRLEG